MVTTCDSSAVSDERRDLTQSEAMIRKRIVAAMDAAKMSSNHLSKLTGVDRRTIDRIRAGERFPTTNTLLKITNALGVDIREEGSESNVEPLSVTLLGFLSEVQSRGLARWAATAPREQTPTLAEAAKALHVLHASPQYSTSDGAPIDGWGAYLTELRASGFRMPTPSKRSPKAAQAEEDALREDLGERGTTGALTATPPKGRKK